MKKTYHAWYTRTEEGEKREVRATFLAHGQGWRLMAKVKGDEEWTQYPEPQLEDVQQLYDVIHAKYVRRRATHDEMQAAEKMLRDAGGTPE